VSVKTRLIRFLPRERCAFLILAAAAAAALALGCHPAVDAPGVPLYPSGATARLPRSQIAQIAGPIAKVDGQEVIGQDGPFDLLPGCHVVELDRGRLVTEGSAPLRGTYWNGAFSSSTYAIRVKAGARYVIRLQIYTGGLGPSGNSRGELSVREEQASGAMADLAMAKSAEEIAACRDSRDL
jgi:hypothetical protein